MGSAADIFVADNSSPTFTVFVLGVFYVPSSSGRSMAVGQPSISKPKGVDSGCDTRVVAGFKMTPFVVLFHSQPVDPNKNFAYGFAESLQTDADTAASVFSLLTPLSAPLLYTSSTGSPSPTSFNESGVIAVPQGSASTFAFASTTDGTVVSVLNGVTMGSIAYHISNGQVWIKVDCLDGGCCAWGTWHGLCCVVLCCLVLSCLV